MLWVVIIFFSFFLSIIRVFTKVLGKKCKENVGCVGYSKHAVGIFGMLFYRRRVGAYPCTLILGLFYAYFS